MTLRPAAIEAVAQQGVLPDGLELAALVGPARLGRVAAVGFEPVDLVAPEPEAVVHLVPELPGRSPAVHRPPVAVQPEE
jgi:hypothetical protein